MGEPERDYVLPRVLIAEPMMVSIQLTRPLRANPGFLSIMLFSEGSGDKAPSFCSFRPRHTCGEKAPGTSPGKDAEASESGCHLYVVGSLAESFRGWYLPSQWSRSCFLMLTLSKCSQSALCIPGSTWDPGINELTSKWKVKT